MAIVKLVNADGLELDSPERLCGDDFDVPVVTFVVCDAGQFIDPDSEELRFIPAPPEPVIERVEVTDTMGTGAHVVADLPTGRLLKESDEFYLELFKPKVDAAAQGEDQCARKGRLRRHFFEGGDGDW